LRIFISGVSCVGKTAIGSKLAELLDCPFYDLDEEVETFFSTPIEILQNKLLNMHSFRKEASKAFVHLLNQKKSENAVISIPPSGLMSYYWQVLKKSEGITIVLFDKAENILKRITFYDKHSHRIQKTLSKEESMFYLKDIKNDMSYFRTSYKRANIWVDISGLDIVQSAIKVKEELETYFRTCSTA
jgi:shikimate kinase